MVLEDLALAAVEVGSRQPTQPDALCFRKLQLVLTDHAILIRPWGGGTERRLCC